jgi:hypothetical protein
MLLQSTFGSRMFQELLDIAAEEEIVLRNAEAYSFSEINGGLTLPCNPPM